MLHFGTVFVDLDRSGQWFCFQAPYDPDFIAAFKVRVPHSNRRWRPDERVWCVTHQFWASTEKLLRKYYETAKFEVGPAAEAAQIELLVEEVAEPSALDYMTLGIRTDTPDCVVHAAYVALEKMHFDSGLDPSELAQLIYSIEEIQEAYTRVCAMRDISPQPMRTAAECPPHVDPDNRGEDVKGEDVKGSTRAEDVELESEHDPFESWR